jgi:site-specific DNA-adenine methylase
MSLEKYYDPETVVLRCTICETMSHGYFVLKIRGENGFCRLNTEGEFNGEIIKSQPILLP